MSGFSKVGTAFPVGGIRDYIGAEDLSWARGVCLHHTAFPDLKMREQGLVVQHLRNIAHFYRYKRRWSRGPHLFVDDVDYNGMTPLSQPGVHARAFNRYFVGIEVLGNYDREDPKTGRGKKAWYHANLITACLLAQMGLVPDGGTVKFHREDPKTSKTCPGRLVGKGATLVAIQELMPTARKIMGEDPAKKEPKQEVLFGEKLKWQVEQAQQALAKGDLGEVSDRLKNMKWLLSE